MAELTQARLREVLNYDRNTGVFRWLVNMSASARIGQLAGCKSRGYIVIRVDGTLYPAHRLAWLYETGAFPTDWLDHRNLNKADNRFDNLRPATHSQNAANVSRRANCASGMKGVTWHKRAGKWLAQIRKSGKNNYLGLYATKEEAHSAYAAAAFHLHGEFARFE